MKVAEDNLQTLNNYFYALNEENRKNIIEMTKFLIITQNSIVPELLNFNKNMQIEDMQIEEGKKL
jgi:hypothetical protein